MGKPVISKICFIYHNFFFLCLNKRQGSTFHIYLATLIKSVGPNPVFGITSIDYKTFSLFKFKHIFTKQHIRSKKCPTSANQCNQIKCINIAGLQSGVLASHRRVLPVQLVKPRNVAVDWSDSQ